MATTETKRKLRVESAEAVLGLHWFVARDYTMADEGFEVEILLPPNRQTKFAAQDPRYVDHHLVKSTNYQFLFEQNKADIYRACEWGQIRRTYDNPNGPIVARRPAFVCQGIYVRPDSPANAPNHLIGKSVGVQFHQGSHYTTLQMLEGFLSRDEINLVHAGTVQERYEALMSGEIEAATLMEPWITLAEKMGCKKLTETHYAGTENASKEIDADTWLRINRGLKRAVDLINDDKRRYVHYLIEEMPERYQAEITPDDFYLPRLRYVDPAPYSQEEFQHSYDWMLSWDLVGEDATFDHLVCNLVAS